MKRLLNILFLFALTVRASIWIPTNEVNVTVDATSWDTEPYHLFGDYMATHFYNVYPQYTNHIYTVSRSGASWQNQFQSQQEKYCLPLWSNFRVSGYDLMMASENGGYNTTNPVIQWGTNLFNAPPLFWNGTAVTNEGNIVTNTITHIAIGCFPDDTNGAAGNKQLDIGCQMLNIMYGQTPIGLYSNLYIPYWSNDFRLATPNIQFYAGGHPNPAGHLCIAIQTLLNLGAETNIGSVTFNWNATTATTNNCTVSGLTTSATTLSTTIKYTRMPMAWDVPDGTITNDARGAFAAMPQFGSAFQWTIAATNMPTGLFNIAIDGVIVDTATDIQLATGRNWFTNYVGPLWNQRKAVLRAKRDQYGCDPVTLVNYQVNDSEVIPGVGRVLEFQSNANQQYDVNGKRGTNYVNSMTNFVAMVNQYDDRIQQTSIQTPHLLTITKVGTLSTGTMRVGVLKIGPP